VVSDLRRAKADDPQPRLPRPRLARLRSSLVTLLGWDETVTDVFLILPADGIEQVARRAAEIVLERLNHEQNLQSAYLTATEAAQLMRSKRQRVYDLLSAGRLTRFKDGRRVLVSRTEIEKYLAVGAHSPIAPALPTVSRRRTDACELR
jgi:excisionase family DNA binding protein